jgi:cyclopropane-fatty-acyl-phospholipid synthase
VSVISWGLEAAERGWLPDFAIRRAIQRLCADRMRTLSTVEAGAGEACRVWVEEMGRSPIAPVPLQANEQHYELPPEFFSLVLGPRRKYSCCYWDETTGNLEQAEVAALRQTCEHAQLADGQEILELGCGWGSLSLWMAEQYPASRITAVSNSAPQRRFIEAQACERGITNLKVVTADMNDFAPPAGDGTAARFDRVVSVEMFEHMRNWPLLLERISGWLRPAGKLFVHVFCHRSSPYPFETEGDDNWMGRHFFSGGQMPSLGQLALCDEHLAVSEQQVWNGRHYQQTSEAWLANLDRRHDDALAILAKTYGPREAPRRLQRWRMFFLAVAELFGYAGGDQWFVAHYLLEHAGRLNVRPRPDAVAAV